MAILDNHLSRIVAIMVEEQFPVADVVKELKRRVPEHIDQSGLSRSHGARRVGVSPSTLTDWSGIPQRSLLEPKWEAKELIYGTGEIAVHELHRKLESLFPRIDTFDLLRELAEEGYVDYDDENGRVKPTRKVSVGGVSTVADLSQRTDDKVADVEAAAAEVRSARQDQLDHYNEHRSVPLPDGGIAGLDRTTAYIPSHLLQDYWDQVVEFITELSQKCEGTGGERTTVVVSVLSNKEELP